MWVHRITNSDRVPLTPALGISWSQTLTVGHSCTVGNILEENDSWCLFRSKGYDLRLCWQFEYTAFNSAVCSYGEVKQLKAEVGHYVLYIRISHFFLPTLAGGGRDKDFAPDLTQSVHWWLFGYWKLLKFIFNLDFFKKPALIGYFYPKMYLQVPVTKCNSWQKAKMLLLKSINLEGILCSKWKY